MTVETLNAAGFSCVAGDKVDAFIDCGTVVDGNIFSAGDVCGMQMYVKTSIGSVTRFDIASLTIKELIPRPITGIQPVGDNCVVEVITKGCLRISHAKYINWNDTDYNIYWIPHLPLILEQQMVDKSVLELTERELSDGWVSGDKCEYEGELFYYVAAHPKKFLAITYNDERGLFEVAFSLITKPLTPEQIRIKNGQALKELFESLQHEDTDAENVWANLADLVTLKSEHHA